MALYKDESDLAAQGLKRAETAPYGAPRAMVSSAARLSLSSKSEAESIRQRNSVSAGWQVPAWQCYKNVGEVNYAFNYSASVLSRIRLLAAVVVGPDQPPIEVTDATRIVTDDSGSTTGTVNGIDPRLAKLARRHMVELSTNNSYAVMLKAFGLNIQVAGECYLCCINDRWYVKSTREITIDASGRPKLQPSASIVSIVPHYLRKGTPIGRIWSQDPEYSLDADSSLRAVLADCEELILLSRLMRVAARSRLNAGLLYVPDEISAAGRTMGGTDDTDDSDSDEDLDEFEKELFDSMTAPVAQEDNAAAIVPMLVRGPGASGKDIVYMQMSRNVGDELSARSKDVLNRVLQGINAPKELATGMSGSRYNNAQLIDEQSYKALVEPMALTFSDAVTEIFLQPLLRADAQTPEVIGWEIEDLDEQIARIVCWYDPSEVVTSVDRSQAANDGWDRKALSDKAWRKAHGFSENDAPSQEELGRRLVMSQVALDPATQQSLLKLSLPNVFAKMQSQNEQSNGVGLPPDLESTLNGTGSVAPSPPVPANSVPADVSA